MNQENPLIKYFRKPKIYVTLPTGGKFNPELKTTLLDEVGVSAMSAIDEISLRNPEALLNGEAIKSVIESCVPTVGDPMQLCNIDIEALFLAIQYATYGNDLTHEHTCENCKEIAEYKIDVNEILNRFPSVDYIDPILFEDVNIHIRPPTLENVTRMALIDLEQKKIVQNLQKVDDDIEDMDIASKFYTSFKKIATFNVDMLANAISRIESPDAIVTDTMMISEFLQNVPTNVVQELNKAIEKIAVKPENINKMQFKCGSCDSVDEVYLEINPINFLEAG
ncbi:hypothetical protein N9I00_01700 [bacterium]|nr:hypothetical protein [bacterium]